MVTLNNKDADELCKFFRDGLVNVNKEIETIESILSDGDIDAEIEHAHNEFSSLPMFEEAKAFSVKEVSDGVKKQLLEQLNDLKQVKKDTLHYIELCTIGSTEE